MTPLTVAIAIFVLIAIIDIVHYGVLFEFLRKIHKKEWHEPETPYTPRAAVILTLRGADPFLNRCVDDILSQDYPDYAIFFVVDHASDPALPIVREIQSGHPDRDCRILVVDEHLDTCALKCNSLYHVISRLDSEFEVIVVVDSDTTPHATWLRELVEPLSDSRYAATSGLRWYVPEVPTFGSLVRHLWNVAASCQMVMCRIPWGGSMAIHRDALEQGGLAEAWKHAFSDDVLVYKLVRDMGRQTVIAPSVMMVNREVCTIRSFYPWVKRQLLIAKMYHPRWGVVVMQAFFLSAPLLAALGLCVYGSLVGDWATVAWSAGALGLYCVGVMGALLIVEGGVRKMLRKRGDSIERQSFALVLKSLVALPLTQAVYSAAIVGLYRMKISVWRGIRYHIGPKNSFKMEKYVPYAEVEKRTEDKEVTSL